MISIISRRLVAPTGRPNKGFNRAQNSGRTGGGSAVFASLTRRRLISRDEALGDLDALSPTELKAS